MIDLCSMMTIWKEMSENQAKRNYNQSVYLTLIGIQTYAVNTISLALLICIKCVFKSKNQKLAQHVPDKSVNVRWRSVSPVFCLWRSETKHPGAASLFVPIGFCSQHLTINQDEALHQTGCWMTDCELKWTGLHNTITPTKTLHGQTPSPTVCSCCYANMQQWQRQ